MSKTAAIAASDAPPETTVRGFGPIDRPVGWFAALLIVETLVFFGHVQIRIAPYYPQVFDQLRFIAVTQDILRDVHSRGMVALLAPFVAPDPTGITYPVQGALSVLAFGESRAALLTVNLMYFLIAQATMFFTVMRTRAEAPAAWIAISTFVACNGLFRRAGGMSDYRIDFAAMCLFGIWICLVAVSDRFLSRKYSILAGVVAAALILMRFITAAFVGPVMAAMLVLIVLRLRADASSRQRLVNYAISGATIVIVATTALAEALGAINNYYVAGHIKGAEPAIRAAQVGIFSRFDDVIFYPKEFLNYQIGSACLVMIIILLVAIVVGFARRPADRTGLPFDLPLLVAATALPMLVLTLDTAKSPVVAGNFLIPFLLLVTLCWRSFVLPVFSGKAIRLATLWYMGAGVGLFVLHAAAPSSELSEADLAQIATLNRVIAGHGGQTLSIAFDRMTDYLNPSTVRYYDPQTNDLTKPTRQFNETLGGFLPVEPAAALRAVASSDIVVLSDETSKRDRLPFDTSMAACWPLLDSYARRNLNVLATGTIDGMTFRIFARP